MKALRLWAALYIDTNIVQDRDTLRNSIYDVLGNAPEMDDDDVGPDVYVDIRDLTNASVRIGAHEVYVQTRAYIFAVGDIYGLTEEELRDWWRQYADFVGEHYDVLDEHLSFNWVDPYPLSSKEPTEPQEQGF